LEYVQQIVGHEISQLGITGVYGTGGDATRLFEEINRVNLKIRPIKALV
jgi:hypothetical protein